MKAKKSGLFTIQIDRFEVPALIAVVARCGGYDRGFETEIEVTTNSLDEEGFVVHNEKLMEAIRHMFGTATLDGECETCTSCDGSVIWKASCEELTAGVAHVITRMIPLDRLKNIRVRVFNHLGYTSFEWTPENEIPEFPRRATEEEIAETRRVNEERGYRSLC